MTGGVTGRTDAAVLAAITLVVLGAVFGNAALFVAAAVPVSVLSVNWLARPPAPDVTVERRINPSPVAPGDRTEVTLTVHNEGDTTVSDARFVDGVPAELSVASGTPRGCFAIRPGESESISYEIVPRHGRYEFGDPVARFRSLSGAAVRTERAAVVGDTMLSCRRDVGDVPSLEGSLRRVGIQPTDSGGTGIQFHSTREYRPGDGIRRIDWRRLAKTGDLTTVKFNETSAAETVAIVDGRPSGRRARASGYPTATELAAYAADRTIAHLVSTGNDVGLYALGVAGDTVDVPILTDEGGHPWVPTGQDETTRKRIDAVLDAVVEGASGSTDSGETTTPDGSDPNGSDASFVGLRRRLSGRTDVIVATPMLDELPVTLVETLVAAGNRTIVIAPDVTGHESLGQTVEHVERAIRIGRLRASDATVVDWDTRQSLSGALEAGR